MKLKILEDKRSELTGKDISNVKQIIKLTLEKINESEKERDLIQEHIRILKHDLDDFKDGRIDRILERHKISDTACGVSIFEIEKKVASNNKNHWYDEYSFKGLNINDCIITNSAAKVNASGTYKLSDGSIRYF